MLANANPSSRGKREASAEASPPAAPAAADVVPPKEVSFSVPLTKMVKIGKR
jgi:hypothetical protein